MDMPVRHPNAIAGARAKELAWAWFALGSIIVIDVLFGSSETKEISGIISEQQREEMLSQMQLFTNLFISLLVSLVFIGPAYLLWRFGSKLSISVIDSASPISDSVVSLSAFFKYCLILVCMILVPYGYFTIMSIIGRSLGFYWEQP